MRYVSKIVRTPALITVLAVVLSACGNQTPEAKIDSAISAKNGMRVAVLRRAIIDNGFVRATELEVPSEKGRHEVGKLIFSSSLMSINGSISCIDCHLEQFGSSDGLPNAIGVGAKGAGAERLSSSGRILPRNALPLWGRGGAGFDTFFWDGKVTVKDGRVVSQYGDHAPSEDPLVVAVHLPSVELREMVNDTPEVHEKLVSEDVSSAERIQSTLAVRFAADPKIGPLLAKSYGVKRGELTFNEVGDALASFIRHEFRVRQTNLERFVFDDGSITQSELAGGILFYGRGKCAACHGGPYFSDLSFHAVAFPQLGFGKNGFGVDEGRYNVTLDPSDRFLFRTPPLYNVSKTAPYSHSGSVVSLEDAIISHFDPLRLTNPSKMTVKKRSNLFARLGPASREPLPSGLTDEEVRELVSFLRMLDF
jgi:cytochrome c peroxidase